MVGERFKVIDGGVPIEQPKRKRKATSKRLWSCRRCLAEDGHASRYLTKIRADALEDGQLRISGGRDVWVCTFCLMKGRFTPQTS